MSNPRKHTQRPIVTGTSVIALKYAGGVMMAADTLGSYGSLARFTDNRRLISVHNSTIIGGSGDFSDFQHLKDLLHEKEIEDFNMDDQCELTSPEIFHYLQRVLYQRRNKFDPLWNSLVVGGFQNSKPYLGIVNMIGMGFEDNFVATGFGHHFAMPLLRTRWKENLSEEDARVLLLDCMRTCFYRDCRTINRIQIAKVTTRGTEISEPFVMDTKWDYKSFVDPKAGAEYGGSW